MKTALITGITGQDGSYLAELLLGKGYTVYGLLRRTTAASDADPRLQMVYGDLLDGGSLGRLIRDLAPDEIYHLGAQSHVRVSFDLPELTGDVTGLGTARLLEAIRESGMPTRFYQASSSEMFGQASTSPQSEATPFAPCSPYGAAKLYAHWMTVLYRQAYGLFACSGILFNHESPRRGDTFVSRKITKAAARIKLGLQHTLALGNLDAQRDWGFAGNYVEAMWRMLQQEQPDDYVIATGETHTVRDFLDVAFEALGLDWRQYVTIDMRYYRPNEVNRLIGDASKAKDRLDWEPTVRFHELVTRMVDADLAIERATHGEQVGAC